ncbi:helix-turn-helix domain-containing protein [Clostridium perfringens]|uniref:helix-turn-helix domain-containing protein n=1 Tax=Clostridium perfringens TaxID=1502 RepID=UPI0024BC6D20|nr:helix-turn-helix transcriptional regulator [Clostridium perfringens]
MLANKLKQYRKDHGLTQNQFSEKIGISRSYLADLENGRKLANIKTLNKIASATNSSLNEWIDKTDNTLEKNYKRFEVLGIYLDNLKAAGKIIDGVIPPAYYESIIKILEAELKLNPKEDD